ncbi:SH3 domain-containing protein [Streptomyces sp. NBC_01205]|uniref:SH3 domain-containing protein n=1 Tax=Streptomyces sp. NBC_01205 TaxID=2903771 RepID=UPI002E0EDDD4|nr:SH3 domain-containing protein [Streptomyces sp. NBC_01205]
MGQRNKQTVMAMATVGLGLGLLLPGVPPAAAQAGEAHTAPKPAAPAEAAHNPHVKGVVVSGAPLHVRARPTTTAKVLGTLDPAEEVELSCQAKGAWVEGNNIWYRLHGEPGWVSARFVHNYTPVRWC